MKRKVNRPKIQVEDIPAPPPLKSEEKDGEKNDTTNKAESLTTPIKQKDQEGAKKNGQDDVSLDLTKDEFDYYFELKNRKLKSETHTQITLRLPKTLNNEINKLGRGMKKGWKQDFITHALEKEVAKLKEVLRKNKK